MKHKISTIVFLILTLAVIGFIFSNSAETAEESGAKSGAVAETIKEIVDPKDQVPDDVFEHMIRKMAHFTEFALLGFCAMVWSDGLLWRNRGWRLGTPMLLTLLVACLDEVSQFFSEGRGPGVKDVCIDFAGGITGTLVMAAILAVICAVAQKRTARP